MILNMEYPYEGEAFYSWIVRMYNESTFVNPNAFLIEVFGKACKMYHDGIGWLEQLGGRYGFSQEELNKIIIQNSLLPLTQVFINPRLQNYYKKTIWSSGGTLIGKDKNPTYEVCPICYLKDLKTKGELYLRIYRQIQGVFSCVEHKVDLIDVTYNPKQLEPIF